MKLRYIHTHTHTYIYTIVRGQMKGAACGHIWHINLAVATAGSILLIQGCTFRLQGVYY